MIGKHQNFTAKEKVKFLRKHLLNHVPVSDICDRIKNQSQPVLSLVKKDIQD
jgi:hypothetical protein